MTNPKKQLKLTKMFRNGATAQPDDDYDQLQEEVRQLEQKLREKQNELFQIQRNNYRQEAFLPKKKTSQSPQTFVRPQKLVLSNSVDALQRDIELMTMLTGTEIQSFKANDHCCIVFHMQHDSEHEIKHGLRIDLKSGENNVSESSLPLGFKLSAVMEEFDNFMTPQCLNSIRKALGAYYDRLEQFEALKKLVNGEAQLFKTLDGSHVEISMFVHNVAEDEDEQFKVDIVLDYRVYDIRPKTYSIKELDLPDDGAAEALIEQCSLFKTKPLVVAVKEAFIDSMGPYKLALQIGSRQVQQPRRKKRFRPNKHQYNDDTFLPEECSDQGEDDEYAD